MFEYMQQVWVNIRTFFETGVGTKRKRLLDNNDNLGPTKRFKRSQQQSSNEMDPLGNDSCDIGLNPFSSRSHMMLSLARKKDNRMPESKSAPWKSTMKENCLEISSDEDDDVIVVSEKRNCPPPTPSAQYIEGSQLQNKAVGVNVVQKNVSPTPIGHLPLHCSTPASSSDKPISRFCPSTGRRVLSSNTSSSISKMRQCSANRIGRTSSGSLNLLAKTRTLASEASMLDKFKYSALLQSVIKTHAKLRFPKSFLNLQDVERSIEQSSRSVEGSSAKPKIEILDLTKPGKLRQPIRLEVKSSYPKESDDSSDVEIVSVTPICKPIVPRVNSFEKKIKNSQYTDPDWLTNLSNTYKKVLEKTDQESQNEQIKKDMYAKQNEKALDPIAERIKRHMVITETIILDEAIEEEKPTKLPELTPAMLKQIQSALIPHPASAVVAEGFGLRITRSDMHTLANVNWLNDEVINFYMNLLIERSEEEKGLPKVYAFNTFFFPKLLDFGHESLRRWTRRIDIFAKDLIVVPVHLGVHWCMAIIDFRNKRVEYYDSMGHANNKCLEALLKYLEEESVDKKKTPYDTSNWDTVNMKDIPQQMNGSDCGMFACTFAEYKCRNAKFTFSQKDMPYLRKKMVYEILTKKLML